MDQRGTVSYPHVSRKASLLDFYGDYSYGTIHLWVWTLLLHYGIEGSKLLGRLVHSLYPRLMLKYQAIRVEWGCGIVSTSHMTTNE